MLVLATEAAASDMVEQVWDWEAAMEVVVEAMRSQQEVEAMEEEAMEEEEAEWCMEEAWAEGPEPW